MTASWRSRTLAKPHGVAQRREHPAVPGGRRFESCLHVEMDRDPGPEEQRATASPSYALGRLWRAIETATTHADPAIRKRAEEKALAWEAVLSGMASGTLDVGSRTPV